MNFKTLAFSFRPTQPALPAFLAMVFAAALITPAHQAIAATEGEWWEMNTKMEMPGMLAMPAGQAVKFCRPKGDEGKPVKSDDDKNCTITDVKNAGNTMTFNMKCTGKDAMSGSGEITSTPTTFNQKIKMRTGGETMAMVSTGKRIGGACKEGV